jgi:hypothetical protein
LLDILVDGFEKNEVLGGFHWRTLPLRDEGAAIRKLDALATEATGWKGTPHRDEREGPRRIVAWPDLELRQIGRGLMVRARATRFHDWWHASETWQNDPIGPLYEWLDDER